MGSSTQYLLTHIQKPKKTEISKVLLVPQLILPLILGPSLGPWVRYSHETIKNIAEGKTSMSLDMSNYFVDVRDCGAMHIAIMNGPSTNGRRHPCYSVKGRTV